MERRSIWHPSCTTTYSVRLLLYLVSTLIVTRPHLDSLVHALLVHWTVQALWLVLATDLCRQNMQVSAFAIQVPFIKRLCCVSTATKLNTLLAFYVTVYHTIARNWHDRPLAQEINNSIATFVVQFTYIFAWVCSDRPRFDMSLNTEHGAFRKIIENLTRRSTHLSWSNSITRYEEVRINSTDVPVKTLALQILPQFFPSWYIPIIALN